MSRAKNFRRRADEDDVNGEESDALVIKPLPSKTHNSNKPKKQGPKLLSFADEEEVPSADGGSISTKPSFRVEKGNKLKQVSGTSSRSLLSFVEGEDVIAGGGLFKSTKKKSVFPSSQDSSHKITSGKDRSSHSPSIPSNVQPQAGEYTKEKLRELQKNTRTLGSSKPLSESKLVEPVIVLKGLVKPVLKNSNGLTLDKHEENVDEGEAQKNLEMFRKDKDEAEIKLATMGIGKTRDSGGSLIPDQATINAIRAKRERLRKSRVAPDYISLDGGSSRATGSSDDESDLQGRIALMGDKNDNVKKGIFETVDEGPVEAIPAMEREIDGDDEDEEEKIWEEEQFRKGLGKRVDDSSSRVNSITNSVQNTQQPSAYSAIAYHGASSGLVSGKGVGVSRSVEVMSMSQQAEVATRALEDNLKRLKDSHGRTMSSMTRTDTSLAASLSNITALEKSLSDAGKRFLFMQKLRDFVSVICDFLQDKAPFIEELEEQMQKLHEERASAIIERRVADDADEMEEVEVAVTAAMSVFSKGGGVAVLAAATSAAQAASAMTRERSNLPVQLDEFGRDINLQKRMDLKRRAEVRYRRNAQSESKRMSSSIVDGLHLRIEGESSTDESDCESGAYQSSRGELLQTAEQIFSDAADEYSKLSVVKERFESWKREYWPSYRDAYMSLSVPAIFSPYVRLELLKWDPLYEDADFNNMEWHSLLFNYGMSEDSRDFDPDDDLVPGLVEKVALPILHHDIAHCWDMLSTRGTRNAVSATKLVISYIPATSEPLQELLIAIRTRLAEAVANLIVPTWSNLVIKAVPKAARIAAYRFGVSVRLLRNICLWKDILAMPVLEQLALDELLSGKVLPHVRNLVPNIHDAFTRTERIVASLSGVWSGPNVAGEPSKKLQPLVEYLMTLGNFLEKKQASGVSSEETSGLARRLKRMLVELNEYDKARGILRTFQLREAL